MGRDYPRVMLWAGLTAGTLTAAAAGGDARHWRSLAYAGLALAVLCAAGLTCRVVSRCAGRRRALADVVAARRALRLAEGNAGRLDGNTARIDACERRVGDMQAVMAQAVPAQEAGTARPLPRLSVVQGDAG